jgi:hypothetical protein
MNIPPSVSGLQGSLKQAHQDCFKEKGGFTVERLPLPDRFIF